MNKKKVLVVEDIYHVREDIISLVEGHPDLELKSVATDGKEALSCLQKNDYDLVLLDINLPFLSGIEVLEKIETPPYIIFITAFDQYAVKAFEIGAIDYVLKPIDPQRFKDSIMRFLTACRIDAIQNQVNDVGLTFLVKRSMCIVPYEDIYYISSHGKHCVVHAKEKDYETATLIKTIEAKLFNKDFLRIHKQYIININFFHKLKHDFGGQYLLELNDVDESTLPVGRTYIEEIKKKLSL